MRRAHTIQAADLFCGAGGLTAGLLEAAADAGREVELLAINHWDVAIATHSANHPQVRHVCADLELVKPREAVPGRRLHLLMAAPACTDHSNARGGKPMDEQQRVVAWRILEWAAELYVDHLLIENVREFLQWGPLGANGRPLKSKRGQFYQQFVRTLKVIGYRVEHRILCAADYGDATTRERLFIQARRDGKPIEWPEATHQKTKDDSLGLGLPARRSWKPAREIIDWSLPGKSIYGRKKPLAPNTMARIYAGLRKFSGLPFHFANRTHAAPRSMDDPIASLCTGEHMAFCQPFLVVFRNRQDVASLDEPLKTLTGMGANFALIEPFLVSTNHSGANGAYHYGIDEPLRTVTTQGEFALVQPFLLPHGHGTADERLRQLRSVDAPMPTITGQSSDIFLVEPFIMGTGGREGSMSPRSIDEPLRTVLTDPRLTLVQPFLLPHGHGTADERLRQLRSVDAPMPTITGQGQFGLVQPFLLGQQSGAAPRSVDAPAPTVAGAGAISLIEPFLVEYHGHHAGRGDGDTRTRSVDDPLPTQTVENRFGLAQPFIFKFNGTGGSHPVDAPLDTITGKDRFGLVELAVDGSGETLTGEVVAVLDVRFRMLQAHELAGAHSFPKSYHFSGNRSQKVKQIGNSVPKELGRNLCRQILTSASRRAPIGAEGRHA